MSLETACPACQRVFRVPAAAAGKKIRCPGCGGAIQVAGNQPAASADQWYLKDEEGNNYGPVPRGGLDAWYEEGRITADCQLLRAGQQQWQWAADVYPELEEEEEEEEEKDKDKDEEQDKVAHGLAPASTGSDLARSSRSKAIAGLLGIFLGPLGTHRFYLGYWGLGLAMLFTAGGCGVWSLIDAICVILGRVRDADGRPLSD